MWSHDQHRSPTARLAIIGERIFERSDSCRGAHRHLKELVLA